MCWQRLAAAKLDSAEEAQVRSPPTRGDGWSLCDADGSGGCPFAEQLEAEARADSLKADKSSMEAAVVELRGQRAAMEVEIEALKADKVRSYINHWPLTVGYMQAQGMLTKRVSTLAQEEQAQRLSAMQEELAAREEDAEGQQVRTSPQ
jgi:hypothetical protein